MSEEYNAIDAYIRSGKQLRDRLFLKNLSSVSLSPEDSKGTLEMLIQYRSIRDNIISLESEGSSSELQTLSRNIRETDEHLTNSLEYQASELENQVAKHKRLDKDSFVGIMESLDTLFSYASHVSRPTDSYKHRLQDIGKQAHQKVSKRKVSYKKSCVGDKTINVYTFNDRLSTKNYLGNHLKKATSRNALATYLITGTVAFMFYAAATQNPSPDNTQASSYDVSNEYQNTPSEVGLHYDASVHEKMKRQPIPVPLTFQGNLSDKTQLIDTPEKNEKQKNEQDKRIETQFSNTVAEKSEYTSRAKEHVDEFFGKTEKQLSIVDDSIRSNDGLVTNTYLDGEKP